MEAMGESLDDQKAQFKLSTMAHDILMMRLQQKITKPALPEMIVYYEAHKDQYNRPAQIRWSEILIPAKGGAKAQARAEAIRARLLQGEPFEALAKAESAGDTASKGGLWPNTTPGSLRSADLNKALDTQPIGAIGPVIADAKGFHIVRVESRRGAGPAKFHEVQKEVADELFREGFLRHRDELLKKLRARTAISAPLFEGTDSAPSMVTEPSKKDAEAKPAGYR